MCKPAKTPLTENTEPRQKTLAQKVAQLALKSGDARLPTTKPAAPGLTAVNKNYCQFCGNPRLDGDPTGVTCGTKGCLSTLGKQWNEAREEKKKFDNALNNLREIAGMLEISTETLADDDVEKTCKRIKTRVEPMESALQRLKELAQKLGLDKSEIGDSAEDIERQIEEIINDSWTELCSAAESLGLSLNSLPANIKELCQVIAKESSAVNEAVEKLKEESGRTDQ